MFKLIVISILIGIVFIVGMDYNRFRNLIPGQNDCAITYIKSGASTGSLYMLEGKYPHVQTGDEEYLKDFKAGTASGCIMSYTNKPLQSLADTKFCYLSKHLFLN